MHREAADALASDDTLAPLVAEHGPLALEPADDLFERLVVSIIRQQVSMDAAAAIRERVFERFEVTPAAVLAADEDALRDAGLSAAKVEYVRAAAERFQQRDYDRDFFADLSTEDVLAELGEIRGIGPWTGKMFCLFCLGRPDVFPVEDLGVRKGMWQVADSDMSRNDMVERAEPWRPYRSYAALYLWRAADG
ncbi:MULTISPECIES: DNA-3-methyladenine glycosylase family protein [Salinibaculum]|uniref:DNA-3-methyladenine glycosylase family protein n=1 Tax=Salinibaculum TaxID=2732368 RepID=UPI0030D37AAA